ncbi:MAG: DUF1761 domain-containing protein [Bacteroidota bacterium]
MEPNFWIWLVTGLTPVIIGFIWYNPAVFGKAWMSSAGLTQEQLEDGSKLWLLILLTYIFGVFASFILTGITVHQIGIFSILSSDPSFATEGSAVQTYFMDFMSKYGDVDRNFGHGAFHGVFATIGFVLPIIGMSAIYERRGWKYILVHCGFWAVCLAIMGGLIAMYF